MADEKIKSNQARNNQKAAAGGKPMVLEAEQVRGIELFLSQDVMCQVQTSRNSVPKVPCSHIETVFRQRWVRCK